VTNPLNQRYYSVNVIVADIGYLTDDEQHALKEAIGPDGIVHFTSDLKQLHIFWQFTADTINDAIDSGRATLRQVTDAIGVAVPRTRKFEVNESAE
jgi:hypothetical protein